MTRVCWFVVAYWILVLPSPTAPEQKRDWMAELERGYKTDSQEPLLAFVDSWRADSEPVGADIMRKKPPFEQDIYAVYSTFYRPENATCVIIQDKIRVLVVDSDLRDESADVSNEQRLHRLKNLKPVTTVVIEDFRPKVNVPEGTSVLFLQDKYLAGLIGFLVQHKKPYELLQGDEYQRQENVSEERRRRLHYLNRSLSILRGHWAMGWVVETEPTVSCICLSTDMKTAIVRYRLRFGFGEALLEKVGEHSWRLMSMTVYATE